MVKLVIFILRAAVSLLSAGLLLAAAERPQWIDTGAQDARPRSDADSYYSGTIVDVTADKLIVSRTILGKPAEQRTFLITSETRVEGKMHPRSRVTVRYTPTEQGEVALSILVRADGKQEKKK
jgi:hypothetical protein